MVCVYGEFNVLWNIIEDEDCVLIIFLIYIEMLFCFKCEKVFENLLVLGQEIFFLFKYFDEVVAWLKVVCSLCVGQVSFV